MVVATHSVRLSILSTGLILAKSEKSIRVSCLAISSGSKSKIVNRVDVGLAGNYKTSNVHCKIIILLLYLWLVHCLYLDRGWRLSKHFQVLFLDHSLLIKNCINLDKAIVYTKLFTDFEHTSSIKIILGHPWNEDTPLIKTPVSCREA